MYRYGYQMMGVNPILPFGGIIGLIFWVLLVALILGLLVHLFIKSSASNDVVETDPESALNILKKRYAKGEITKKEFDQMKKDIA